MTKKEKELACKLYFDNLCEKLKDTHEVVGSCNKDMSVYLIPKGTVAELSYYGKPIDSYRFSDHWNWFSNVKKCSDSKMVQCNCVDLPWPKKRNGEGLPSSPIFGVCVAYYGEDKKYHHVFGEKFNRKTKEWAFE